MAVPDTHTFPLRDVLAETGGNSLREAFANSIDSRFDPAYKGNKDRLSNFRNYNRIVVPSAVIDSIYNIGQTIATVSCSCAGNGITERGIVWNTAGNPTVSDGKAIAGSAAGSYEVQLNNLSVYTYYYVRAYAITSAGIGYSPATQILTRIPVAVDLLRAVFSPLNGEVVVRFEAMIAAPVIEDLFVHIKFSDPNNHTYTANAIIVIGKGATVGNYAVTYIQDGYESYEVSCVLDDTIAHPALIYVTSSVTAVIPKL